MKVCPHCAEEIKMDAVKCRYCGEQVPSREEIEKSTAVFPNAHIGHVLLFFAVVVFLIWLFSK